FEYGSERLELISRNAAPNGFETIENTGSMSISAEREVFEQKRYFESGSALTKADDFSRIHSASYHLPSDYEYPSGRDVFETITGSYFRAHPNEPIVI